MDRMQGENVPFKLVKEMNVFVLLFIVIAAAIVLTHILPAGEYARVEVDGRTVVDPASFKWIEPSPVGPFELFKSVHTGMVEAGNIIFYVLIVGGTFGILAATGAVEAFVVTLSKRLANQERWLIPVMMLFFAAAGSLMGLAEETLPYLTLFVPLAVALGFDVITGAAIVLVGASVGFTSAIMNPFTVGVAQGIAELPPFSGIGFRLVLFVVLYLAAVIFVYRYAMKVKKDRSLGFFGEYDRNAAGQPFHPEVRLETRHKWVLACFLLNLIVLATGVIQYGWFISEIAGLFLLLGIIIGMVGRLSPNQMVEAFMNGAASLIMGALVIGVARAILVVLNEGHIMDTILYYAAAAIHQIPPSLSAVGMYILQFLLNFIVPSGSGQASLTMPIMAPLADLVGVTRQTAVLAFQLGDGISNILFPTSGYFMAGLALAGIPWAKWVKWIFPFIVIQFAIGLAAVIVAQAIHYGPF